MAHTLRLKQSYRPIRGRAVETIGSAARVLAEEQALALRAAEKAASPRRSVAELRAMYHLPAAEPQHEKDSREKTTKSVR